MTDTPETSESNESHAFEEDGNRSGLPDDDPRLQPKGPPTEGEPGLGEIQT